MDIHNHMPKRSRHIVLLFVALGLGVLGDLLFYPGLLGLNVFIWAAGLALAVLALARVSGSTLRGEGRWLLAPALVFAGFVAWPASPVLQASPVAGR